MKNILSNLHKNKHFLYCLLVTVLAHIIPMAGIFMDNMWYKYPYILVSYTIGLMLVVKVHSWYLKNSN